MSITVIVWLAVFVFKQPSCAVHVRVITFVQPITFVTVTNAGVTSPAHASVNTGAVKLGAFGQLVV